ncbi:MAG: YggT family protein [Candidatus Marinimicrobia bacterium]|nr:YggT family protein [Candidatus Neomarinimicrobiota bacterium]
MLFSIINLIFQFLYICLIARVVLSWVPHNAYNPIVQIVYKITDPMLRPIQQIIPPLRIGFDISPIIAIVALGFIKKIIVWAMF